MDQQVRPDGDVVARTLRAAGLAVTRPRRAVHRVLVGRERPLGAGEVFDLLRANGARLSLTSVYRVLHSFAAAGIVHVFAGEQQRFRICDAAPHTHLICEVCGRVIEQPAEVAAAWLAPARQAVDFVANAEHSDLYGRCGRCPRPSGR